MARVLFFALLVATHNQPKSSTHNKLNYFRCGYSQFNCAAHVCSMLCCNMAKCICCSCCFLFFFVWMSDCLALCFVLLCPFEAKKNLKLSCIRILLFFFCLESTFLLVCALSFGSFFSFFVVFLFLNIILNNWFFSAC